MSAVPGRCPACGAAVRVGAQWCTLCYADLRPKPAPVPAPAAPAPAHGVAEVAAGMPLTAAVAALNDALTDLAATPPRPPGESPVAAAQPTVPKVAARWPCLSCGQQNPIELMHCENCGRPFALEATTDIRAVKQERRRRLILAGAIAFGFVMLVLIVTILTTGEADVGTPVGDLPSPGVSAPPDGVQPVPVDPQPTAPPEDPFSTDPFATESPAEDAPSEEPTSIFQTP